MEDLSWLTARPIAHRGLHDAKKGVFENTLGAAKRAVDAGYGIEVDLHPASDGVPMVFHDLTLDRLTGETGVMRERSSAELAKVRIGGSEDHVPSLRELLALVDGRCGLVLELKGHAGADDGFVDAVLADLHDYDGPAAIMSFDHWLVADARGIGTNRPVGLTAEGDDGQYDVHMDVVKRYDIDFVSYGINDLPCRFVQDFRAGGKPAITWTIRSPEDARKSTKHADQITFEGFLP